MYEYGLTGAVIGKLRRYNCADRESYRLFDLSSQQQQLRTAKSKIIREMSRMGKKMTY